MDSDLLMRSTSVQDHLRLAMMDDASFRRAVRATFPQANEAQLGLLEQRMREHLSGNPYSQTFEPLKYHKDILVPHNKLLDQVELQREDIPKLLNEIKGWREDVDARVKNTHYLLDKLDAQHVLVGNLTRETGILSGERDEARRRVEICRGQIQDLKSALMKCYTEIGLLAKKNRERGPGLT